MAEIDKTSISQEIDPMVALTKSLASSDFEVSKSCPNDPNREHPRFSQYKNRNQIINRQSDQGKKTPSKNKMPGLALT